MENKKTIIGIMTPYLSEKLSSESLIERQKKYGYNPENLSGIKALIVGGKTVELASPRYDSDGVREFSREWKPAQTHMIIAGSTEPGEEEVRSMKGSGMIVARYSIFYGKRSGYTGRLPEEGGYSLDMPKDVPTVKALITDENFLEAITTRDMTKIRESIKSINTRLKTPILTTPYLEEALSR